MNIKHVCFDLDGTLIKSDKTIYGATVKTLELLGEKSNLDEDEFRKMIGMHFIDIFRKFDINVDDFEEFIKIYKLVYFDYISESELYDGVEELLSYLSGTGEVKASLLTTKGQDQAEKIINHFRLEKYFDFIMGRREGISHKPSPEPLHFICKQIEADARDSMIVGDTELDIECGKNAGAVTCGVTYGYRERENLKRNEPDFLLDEITGVKVILGDS